MAAALEEGVRYFDTAPYYGYGLAERRLGAALGDQPRQSYAVSTKVGRLLEPREGAPRSDQGFIDALPFDPVFDYSYDAVMRSVEEKIEIPESRKDDFRREIMNYIGALALEGKKFDFKTNERLHKALELKLFEDQKDTIKLTSLVSSVVDDETQAKIDVVKQRLIKYFGYNETSASDVLNYVASIFARGDAKD